MNKWWCKVGLYLLSMVFFLIIVMIIGTEIPVCFGCDCEFLGWKVLLTKGVIMPIICLLLLIITLLFCIWLYQWNKGSRLGTVTETHFTNVNSKVLSFLASYFIPLVSFSLGTTWRHFAVLWLFFVLIGIIYIKSDIYYCNPTLLLLGFKMYKATGKFGTTSDFDQTIIVWGKMKDGDQFKYIPIDNKTCFAYKL